MSEGHQHLHGQKRRLYTPPEDRHSGSAPRDPASLGNSDFGQEITLGRRISGC
jgi:hypothetical protein